MSFFKVSYENIFNYLNLKDLLILSITSKEISLLTIQNENYIENILQENNQTKNIPIQFLNLKNITLEELRKSLSRLIIGKIDSSLSSSSLLSGSTSSSITTSTSILAASSNLSLGYDYSGDLNTFSISSTTTTEEGNFTENEMDIVPIEKHLESNSFDEYDDFNPRHPDYKSHRRGGSFFNSDLSDVAAQVYATDLSLIAKKALDLAEADDMM